MYWLLHGFIAAIFLRAGVGKLIGRRDFYWQIRASAVLPRLVISPMSYAVPMLELCAGIGVLLPGKGSGIAEILAAAMLAAFTGYAVWIAVTGRKVRCFCFGRDDGEIGWATVVRNGMLLCLVAMAAVSPLNRIPPAAALLSLIDGATASLLFVGAFQIHAVRREFAK